MEFTPLLFTPRTGDRLRGGGPGDFRTPGAGLERSPTGGGGQGGGGGAAFAAAARLGSTFREGTPRRRSMTPSGSAMEPSGMMYPPGGGGGSLFESPTAGGPAAQFGHSTQAGWAVAAPPPPPGHSLADELLPGGGGGGAFPGGGAARSSRFALGGGLAAPVATATPHGAAPSSTANPDDPSGCWVTAFGFAPPDRALVLGELARCGDVRRFGSGRAASNPASATATVNWVHVQFGSPAQAARARALDGCLLAGRLLVGVKALDGAGAADVAYLVGGGGLAGEGGDASAGELRMAAPVMPARPYRVDAGDQRALPQHAQSAWSKISELVFGL